MYDIMNTSNPVLADCPPIKEENNMNRQSDLCPNGCKITAIYCRLSRDDEQGGLRFEIDKSRISIRLTAPYSEERRKAASEHAKKQGIQDQIKH